MAAIMVKSHSVDTAARAELVRELADFPVFGGVVLNYPVGGLNPHAVIETARQGGRAVWMPTLSARHFVQRSHLTPMLQAAIPPGVRGLTVTRRGRLHSAVDKILDLIAGSDLILGSGHISPEETAALFSEARRRGVGRLVVTHPQAPYVGLTVAEMRALGEMGAYNEITSALPLDERAAIIRAVGVRHCFLATDGGPAVSPPPAQWLSQFIAGLAERGFSREELRYMTVDVPSYLLRLDGHEERPIAPPGG